MKLGRIVFFIESAIMILGIALAVSVSIAQVNEERLTKIVPCYDNYNNIIKDTTCIEDSIENRDDYRELQFIAMFLLLLGIFVTFSSVGMKWHD